MRGLLESAKIGLRKLVCEGRRYAPIFAFALVVFGGIFLFGHHVSAASTPEQGIVMSIITMILGAIETVLSFLIINAIVPILLQAMNFGNFINAAPVVAGWVVVRDFTNLLFIIVLLVIAFGIIFGLDKYGKVEMLPQMFIMAIAINFSRTLVGFMTDISQVFMMTFVRAFTDAGAGNFVDVFSVSVSKDYAASGTLASVDASTSVTIAHIASVVMLGVVAVLLGYLAIIMLVRIVILWILIILAPLAWFTRLIPWATHAYAEWWEELKAQLTVGPVMAFFIWLALATASGASADFVNATGPGGTHMDGTAQAAPVGSASAQNIVKMIIAAAILFKGLEISQSKMSGITSKGVSKIQGFGGRVTRGAAGGVSRASSAATRALLRGVGSEGGTLQRYGKGASLSGMALADIGKTAQVGANKLAGTRLGRAPLVGAAIGGALAGAGAKISGTGAAITKKEEEALKAGAGLGTPAVNGLELARLSAMKSRSPKEEAQFKELSKMAEGEPKMFSSMEPKQVESFLNARKATTAKIPDATARREAEHHDEEFEAKNLHRLPTSGERQLVDGGKPVTRADGSPVMEAYNPQAEAIKHLPSEFKGKVALEAITVDEKKAEKSKEARDAEVVRVTANISAMAGDPDSLAKMATKDEAAMRSVMRYGSKDDIGRMANSGKISKDDVTTGMASSVPPENLAVLIGNLGDATRSGIRSNAEANKVVVQQLEESKRLDAGLPKEDQKLSPENAGQAKSSAVVNLEIHAGRMASSKPGEPVNMSDTLGIDTGGTMSEAARNNFKQNFLGKDAKVGAQALLNIPPAQIEGDLAKVLGESLSMSVLLELQKQLMAPNSPLDGEAVRRVLEKVSTLKNDSGENRLADQMSKNKLLEEYAKKNPGQAEADRQEALAKAEAARQAALAAKLEEPPPPSPTPRSL